MAGLTSKSILSGPRGRRLCLSLATILSDRETFPNPVRETLFYAADLADPERRKHSATFKTNRSLIGEVVPESTDTQKTPADVAEILSCATWSSPTDAELIEAMDLMIGNARYWQPPDGEDIVAGDPAVIAALMPIADLVAAHPFAAWWDSALDRANQWYAQFPEATQYNAGIRGLIESRQGDIKQNEQLSEMYPDGFPENFSNKWWSGPANWTIPRTTRFIQNYGPAGLYWVEDGMGWDAATVSQIPIPAAAKVYEIDSADAWVKLCHLYPFDSTLSSGSDWRQCTRTKIKHWTSPDWAAVAQDYDGVHLTMATYLASAGRPIPVSEDTATIIAGWDPDATYWLTGLPELFSYPESLWELNRKTQTPYWRKTRS